jgi:hypothetical protein
MRSYAASKSSQYCAASPIAPRVYEDAIAAAAFCDSKPAPPKAGAGRILPISRGDDNVAAGPLAGCRHSLTRSSRGSP